MKRTIIIFVIAALVLISAAIWLLESQFTGNFQEIVMVIILFLVLGFAIFVGVQRLKSSNRNESPEDELSKKIMTKTSSLSYYISLYLWLALAYFSDKMEWETHTIINAGILGMAIIFLFSWIGVKLFGLRNG